MYLISLEYLKQPYMGQTCKELRIKRGLSVAEFSKYANVSRQAVYKFERGQSASIKLFLAYHKLGGGDGET